MIRIKLCEKTIVTSDGNRYNIMNGYRFAHGKKVFLCSTEKTYDVICETVQGYTRECFCLKSFNRGLYGKAVYWCNEYVAENNDSGYRDIYDALKNRENYKLEPAPEPEYIGLFITDEESDKKALKFLAKIPEKEKQLLRDCQKRSQVRTTNILNDLRNIFNEMDCMRMNFSNMKDCKVTVSHCVRGNFSSKYKFIPDGTVCEYAFLKNRISLQSCWRGNTLNTIEFELTNEAKEKLVENFAIRKYINLIH